MANVMFIFPGQGSQYRGMGTDLIKKSDSVKELYNKASSVLGYDIAELSFKDVKDEDRKSTRLNSSHSQQSRMPSSA